jgi:hypothetical protein
LILSIVTDAKVKELESTVKAMVDRMAVMQRELDDLKAATVLPLGGVQRETLSVRKRDAYKGP